MGLFKSKKSSAPPPNDAERSFSFDFELIEAEAISEIVQSEPLDQARSLPPRTRRPIQIDGVVEQPIAEEPPLPEMSPTPPITSKDPNAAIENSFKPDSPFVIPPPDDVFEEADHAQAETTDELMNDASSTQADEAPQPTVSEETDADETFPEAQPESVATRSPNMHPSFGFSDEAGLTENDLSGEIAEGISSEASAADSTDVISDETSGNDGTSETVGKKSSEGENVAEQTDEADAGTADEPNSDLPVADENELATGSQEVSAAVAPVDDTAGFEPQFDPSSMDASALPAEAEKLPTPMPNVPGIEGMAIDLLVVSAEVIDAFDAIDAEKPSSELAGETTVAEESSDGTNIEDSIAEEPLSDATIDSPVEGQAEEVQTDDTEMQVSREELSPEPAPASEIAAAPETATKTTYAPEPDAIVESNDEEAKDASSESDSATPDSNSEKPLESHPPIARKPRRAFGRKKKNKKPADEDAVEIESSSKPPTEVKDTSSESDPATPTSISEKPLKSIARKPRRAFGRKKKNKNTTEDLVGIESPNEPFTESEKEESRAKSQKDPLDDATSANESVSPIEAVPKKRTKRAFGKTKTKESSDVSVEEEASPSPVAPPRRPKIKRPKRRNKKKSDALAATLAGGSVLDELDDDELIGESTEGTETKRDKEDSKKAHFGSKSKKKQKELVGLSIGSSGLRASIVSNGVETFSAEKILPRGVVVDGIIAKPEAFSEELYKFWEESSIPSTDVVYSVNNMHLGLRHFDLPDMDKSALESAISSRVEKALGEFKSNDLASAIHRERVGKRTCVTLSVASKLMVDAFAEAITDAGLHPVGCQIGAIAELKLLRAPEGYNEKVISVVNIGSEITTIVCVADGNATFLRPMNIGGNNFTEEIVSKLGCTWNEAELLKSQAGLDAEPVDSALLADIEKFYAVQEALQNVADRLTQAIADAKSLYEKQHPGVKLKTFSIIGGGAGLQGYPEQAVMFLGADELVELIHNEDIQSNSSRDYAAAIGLSAEQEASLFTNEDHRSFQLTLGGKKKDSKDHSTINTRSRAGAKPSKTRAQKKSSNSISPRLIGMLIAAAILAGASFYSNSLKSQVDDLKSSGSVSTDRSKLPVPKYVGANASTAAQNAANAIISNPSPTVLMSIAHVLDSAHVADAKISTSGGNVIAVSGTLQDPKPGSAAQLSSEFKKIPGVASVAQVSRKTDDVSKFNFTINAPTDAGVK